MFEDRLHALGTIAIALIAFPLAGCGGGVARVSAPPTYGSPYDLVAFVNVPSVEFHSGETVPIEVGVRNPTPHPIRAGISLECISYVIKNSSGTRVAPDTFCLALAISRKIAPGEVISVQLSWDAATREGTLLPAGEYEISSAGLPVSATPVTVQLLAPL
jgi:hypothetical protein